ncbi:UNVERIFIED_CONTAM: hypothetical protein GTU68_025974 [Idotea baltica]|nr:hypothetical protein [Idotea baltica]
MKRIAVLGSTGSIGTQTLEVVREQNQQFCVNVLTANNNVDLLIEQAKTFLPKVVVITNPAKYNKLKEGLNGLDIEILAGATAHVVLTALVGFAGLLPTIAAIKAKKTIALANKETLVVAGSIITKLVEENGVALYPVDSEHSAIFQCLVGEEPNSVEKIVLTASGGPFRGKDYEFLSTATKAQALKHPNWEMGAKITIDSASLMNKGLEVIEAKWLFDLKNNQIEVIVHPQSIVHSVVQFEDGSMKAQMGLPDMKLPIQYALGYPTRLKNDYPRFNFLDYPQLTFEAPNTENFKCLSLAFEAMKLCGNMPCILNAANEVAVAAFLKEEIKFLDIAKHVEYCMHNTPYIAKPTISDLLATDKVVREIKIKR